MDLARSLSPSPPLSLSLSCSRSFVLREGECAGKSTRVDILKGVAAGCQAGRYLIFSSFRSLFSASHLSSDSVTFDCVPSCLPACRPNNWSRSDRTRAAGFSSEGRREISCPGETSLIDRYRSLRRTAWRCWRCRPKILFGSHLERLFRACWSILPEFHARLLLILSRKRQALKWKAITGREEFRFVPRLSMSEERFKL